MPIKLNERIGILALFREDGRYKTFLGTCFSISERDRLWMGAAHTVPPSDELDDLRLGIAFRSAGKLVSGWVEDRETLDMHPDVTVLRAELGAPRFMGLARYEARILEDAHAIGYPDDARYRDDDGIEQFHLRGIATVVQRLIDKRSDGRTGGAGYELGAAIPKGMSGSPLISRAPTNPGLIGICLGNLESQVAGGELRGPKWIEYGDAARLQALHDSVLGLSGRSLADTVGFVDASDLS
jgi:hypothetical protein